MKGWQRAFLFLTKEETLEKIDKQYLQVYESIVEEDNPILVVYELSHRN
mgnify:CR=1 FL=1